MAKYGFKDLRIDFDNSGGVLTDMSAYVLEINGVEVEAILEEAHGPGDQWVEQLFTGLKKANDVTIKGFYDDTAVSGPDVIFNDLGATRTLKVTYGSTKSSSVETLIKNYRRLPVKGELTKYEVVLSPTGAVTEA